MREQVEEKKTEGKQLLIIIIIFFFDKVQFSIVSHPEPMTRPLPAPAAAVQYVIITVPR